MTSHVRAAEVGKWERRERRGYRARGTTLGTPSRPRLSVHRSHRHFHAQIIDDLAGRTIASASTEQKDVLGTLKHGGDKKAAEAVGVKLAERAKAAGVTKVVFDRGWYQFHGRVRAFAEAAAKGGLDFLRNPKKKDKPPKVRKAKEAKPAKEAKAKGGGPPKGGGKDKGQAK